MGVRLGGICAITLDGARFSVSGNAEAPFAPTVKEAVMALDRAAGYTEKAQRQYLKLEAIVTPDFPRAQLAAATNATVTAEFANGWAYTLTGAWAEGEINGNMVDGKVNIELTGIAGFWE